MRRTYISPEYKYDNVYGTFNMNEVSSFFGSKMIKIKDDILIDNNVILYYQELSTEQLSKPINEILTSVSLDNIKLNNHIKNVDIKSKINPILELNIDYKSILQKYLYAILKKNKTFLDVLNKFTINNNIDTIIYDYINYNILNKYDYPNINLFVKYNSILDNNNNLKYAIDYNPAIMDNSYLKSKFTITNNIITNIMTLTYNQEENVDFYNFDYYFNIYYKKI